MDSLPQKINKILSGTVKTFSHFFVFFKNVFHSSRQYFSKDKSRRQVDRNLVYSLAPTKIPRQEQLRHLSKFLDPREKLVLKIAVLVFAISLTYLGIKFYRQHLQLLPKAGGTYSEGVVGYPQTINPLYSSNRDVDADLSRLIYSSLFQYDERGQITQDLASAWNIDASGKIYTVTLRPDVKWHSGENLTVDDVVFTFNLIKDPEFRSPLRSSLNGVEIEKIDDHSVKFTLAEPYADFLSLLTFGIMPQNAWETTMPEAAALSELNLKPVGSGPYKFEALIKSKSGEMKEYHLARNADYYGAKPYIEKIIFKFYPDYNELVRALNDNEIDGASYIPDDLKNDLVAKHSLSIYNLHLPQINAIFFNQTKNKALASLKVRQALAYAIDRDHLLNEVLGGAAIRADGPILPDNFAYNSETIKYNLDAAKSDQLLTDSGYKKIVITTDSVNNTNPDADTRAIIAYARSAKIDPVGIWRVSGKDSQPLVIKLSVPENGRLDVAESIKKDWAAVGVQVIIQQIDSVSLSGDLIAGHNFEAFLYGQAVGFDPDVVSFWHSSQIGGQGLNLAGYSNSEADTLLTEGRQAAANLDLRREKYKKFQEIISADLPAIFLYSPSYTYVQAHSVHGFAGTAINDPSDRLAGINGWYLKTRKHLVW